MVVLVKNAKPKIGLMGLRVQDKILHVFGRAALRAAQIQGRAAALPYREGEEFCLAPWDSFIFAETGPQARQNSDLPRAFSIRFSSSSAAVWLF
jgi:hypothetical protein